jgi:hypothetical protein
MTTELLDLLNVLGRCVALQPRQAELLDEIMASPRITVADLEDAGVLPVPAAATKAPKPISTPGLWQHTEPPAGRSPEEPPNLPVPEARPASDDLLGVQSCPVRQSPSSRR